MSTVERIYSPPPPPTDETPSTPGADRRRGHTPSPGETLLHKDGTTFTVSTVKERVTPRKGPLRGHDVVTVTDTTGVRWAVAIGPRCPIVTVSMAPTARTLAT